MSRQLIVRLKGGLGNQLFCYATAKRLAWFNDAELVLDAVTGFKYDALYRRSYALHPFNLPERLATSAEQMEPFERIRRLLARKTSERKPLERRRLIQQVGVDFDPEILTLRLRNGTTYFDAFGQSENYFMDIRDRLLQDLAMSLPSDDNTRALSEQIQAGSSIAIHVRWFDSGDSTHSSNTSLAYYSNALQQLQSKIGNAKLFIFSDKPDLANELLAPLIQDYPYTLVRHNSKCASAETDFWLMRQCDHFIIGNSTFAWWAAWLREQSHPGTQVCAPGRYVEPAHSVTAWGFPGLLPQRWILL